MEEELQSSLVAASRGVPELAQCEQGPTRIMEARGFGVSIGPLRFLGENEIPASGNNPVMKQDTRPLCS